jgi:hypothetical protein
MLPDPRQYNPELHQRVLTLLSPYFTPMGPDWDDAATRYFEWVFKYEEIHYPSQPVEATNN